MNHARVSLLCAICAALLLGCADTSLSEAIESAVDVAIVPATEAFVTDAAALDEATERFCAAPDEAGLREAQDRWLDTMASWNRAGVYRIGPLYDDPIVPMIDRIESKRPRGTDYTQTVRETIAADLAADTTLDEAYFEGLNFNRGGILALEVLLFEDGADPASNTAADIVAAYAEPQRCLYLRGSSALLHRRAETVLSGWTERFGDAGTPFRDQFVSGVLPDGSDPAVALVVMAVEHVRYLLNRKVHGVADVQLAAAARPDANPYFGNLEVGVLEIERLFSAKAEDGTSLFDVMEARGFEAAAETLREAIAEVLVWVREGSREGAIDPLLELDGVLQMRVPEALDITLPLNFNDGD